MIQGHAKSSSELHEFREKLLSDYAKVLQQINSKDLVHPTETPVSVITNPQSASPKSGHSITVTADNQSNNQQKEDIHVEEKQKMDSLNMDPKDEEVIKEETIDIELKSSGSYTFVTAGTTQSSTASATANREPDVRETSFTTACALSSAMTFRTAKTE